MKKLFLFLSFITVGAWAHLDNKTLCGRDNRQLSYEQRIGRTLKNVDDRVGCSATMISENCAITAGHCVDYLYYLEFNVEVPTHYRDYPVKKAENIYTVDRNSILFEDSKESDWAVFKVKPNKVTGRLPGELYGFFDISFGRPHKGETVTIIGYGKDENNPLYSYVQQSGDGDITGVDRKKLRLSYRVDTMGGNSGASVINKRTEEIIAIHTNGGCDGQGHSNYGSLLYANKRLKRAIRSCLHR